MAALIRLCEGARSLSTWLDKEVRANEESVYSSSVMVNAEKKWGGGIFVHYTTQTESGGQHEENRTNVFGF